MSSEIQNALSTIRKIYQTETKGKPACATFKAASEEAIKAFEAKLGTTLPQDFTEYLETNDMALAFNNDCTALSFEQMVEEWNSMKKQLDDGLFEHKLSEAEAEKNGNWRGNLIKKLYWSSQWIPFAVDNYGNTKCIDLDPGERGDRGQVVAMYTTDSSGPYATDFDSFTNYLNEQAYLYEEKEYLLEENKDGHIVLTLDTYANTIRKSIAIIRDTYIAEATGEKKYRNLEKATFEEIRDFEKKLGESLPKDYADFLKNNNLAMSFDGGFEAIPLARVIDHWEMMKEHLDNGVFDDGRIEHHIKEEFGNWKGEYVKQVWWSAKWIPFAEDSCGNMKCIDLDPGINGEVGQVTAMEIQDGQGPFATNYLSFSSYLEAQVSYYTDKKYNLEISYDGSPLISIDSYM